MNAEAGEDQTKKNNSIDEIHTNARKNNISNVQKNEDLNKNKKVLIQVANATNPKPVESTVVPTRPALSKSPTLTKIHEEFVSNLKEGKGQETEGMVCVKTEPTLPVSKKPRLEEDKIEEQSEQKVRTKSSNFTIPAIIWLHLECQLPTDENISTRAFSSICFSLS